MVWRKIGEQLQVDKALAYALAARFWQAFSGPITIIFIILGLNPAERGIYYGLVSILSIQIFFELGILNILVSQTGHLTMNSTDSSNGQQKMGQLIRASMRWFSSASFLYCVSAIIFGWYTFTGKVSVLDWQLPLVCLAVSAAITVCISPFLAVLEGAGFREDVYRVRFYQMLSGNVVVWLALVLGFKLWALVASSLVQLMWSCYLTWSVHGGFFRQFKLSPASNSAQDLDAQSKFSWTRDVLPLQWRMAIISAVYHFATQFFTVIILKFHSPIEAGRLGMTLSVTGAIQSMALAWAHTKFSVVSAQHGAGNREAAGTMWRRTTVVSTGLLVLALLVACGIIALLPLTNNFAPLSKMKLPQQFIEPWQVLVLAFGCVTNHFVAIQSLYVLSRRSRPFLTAALVGCTSTAIAVWYGGYLYSINGVVWGYALTTSLVLFPLHTFAYMLFRREES